jgi:pyruvate kinase
VTILQDLQGPKIRTGLLESSSVELLRGASLTLTTEVVVGNHSLVSVDFADLPTSVTPGSRVLLDDGKLELVVTRVRDDQVETRVTQGGSLLVHKGVNLPGVKLNVPSLTQKDREDLAFALQHEVDAIALSFVRSPQDIFELRQAISQLAPHRAWTPIIAKLERPEALDNLEEIIRAADGVMVARGDLGVEMSPETVPIAQ